MKTDDLIDLLSTNIEPVDLRFVNRTLLTAVLAGLALALVTAIVALGIRADLTDAGVFGYVLIKFGFGAAVAVIGFYLLIGYARPGGENRSRILLVAAPFAVLIAVAGMILMAAPTSDWGHLLMGQRWLSCLISIPSLAIAPFAVIVWALHIAAPTNLVKTGALAGLVAGSLSAAAYALHCPDDSVPFVALWYGGTMGLCMLAGAALGHRLLRW